MGKTLRQCCHGLLFGLLAASLAPATQEPVEVIAAAELALRERINAYYTAILKGERMSALELVAPESKNDFFAMKYDSLAAFRAEEIAFDDTGTTATVAVLRTYQIPRMGQALDLRFKETWRRIDGQWHIVLPSSQEMDTPFGKLRLGQRGKPANPAELEIKMQERQKNIDPDQYLKALEKAAREASKTKPAEKKPEEKKKKAEVKKPEETSGQKPKPND